jgi:hypothetical protein
MDVNFFAGIDELPKDYLARVLRKLHQLSQLPEKDRKLKREDYSMVVCLPFEGGSTSHSTYRNSRQRPW